MQSSNLCIKKKKKKKKKKGGGGGGGGGGGIWLVGCFGFKGPLRQYFSLYRAVSQREGKREEIDESKNVQTTPTRTYCKCSRPLPYYNLNCRTLRHWKFTQHHRTTRPSPPRGGGDDAPRSISSKQGWLIVLDLKAL